MSIVFDAHQNTLTLHTAHTSYQMDVDIYGRLRHLYYGRRTGGHMAQLYPMMDHSFSPDYYAGRKSRGLSPDTSLAEYTGANAGDFRVGCLRCASADGIPGADFVYESHEILDGAYAVPGMPHALDKSGDCQTLIVRLKDAATGLELHLMYGVYEHADIITRSARLVNAGSNEITLTRALSVCLDIPFGDWDLLHFQGRHEMERNAERVPLMHGIHTISSTRGASSHHHNPFVVLCDHSATEDQGECYGAMLVYSGSHRADIERDYLGQTRVVMGIHDDMFAWRLAPGESFDTPQVILTYTHEGIGALSRRYHGFIRQNIMRSKFAFAPRPVLINNWEATYFNFNADKIISIANQAAPLGIDMLVLDDGRFGLRNDDDHALGDWFVNTDKLPGGLTHLIERVHGMGMKFGIWVEPEMVSEDSDLCRAHPDWAIRVPGRDPAMGRNQLVLDYSRPEVVSHIAGCLARLLSENDIDYVKWDMNRNISDVFSHAAAPERQGEVLHRYMLGLYDLLSRITSAFPDVLFEGCAGGGGRFDAGMLAYFPQIWCSDDTDAVERLSIQLGTSVGYPVSAMGAHVSACPNHQTGRSVPFGTRGVVAMTGAFGYELDPAKLTDEEKDAIRGQVARYKRWQSLIHDGLFYRLRMPEGSDYAAWMSVREDHSEALVSVVQPRVHGNVAPICLKLAGLDPDALYRVESYDVYGCTRRAPFDRSGVPVGSVFAGSQLMYAGIAMQRLFGDCPSIQMHLVRV